jgi:hypothetical protein
MRDLWTSFRSNIVETPSTLSEVDLTDKMVDRFRRPRFGFPGIYDRAPPPPKTLHWKHAPVAGEYHKIYAIICWGILHLAIITRRIGDASLADKSFLWLELELVNTWLPEASIPLFSMKGEAKRLTADSREIFKNLVNCDSPSSMVDLLWTHALCNLNIDQSDPVLVGLERYIADQEAMLSKMSVDEILGKPDSWKWLDVSPNS